MSNEKIEEQILDYEDDEKKNIIENILESRLTNYSLLIAFLANEFYFKFTYLQLPLVILILGKMAYSNLLYKENPIIRNQIFSIDLKKRYFVKIFYILLFSMYLLPDMFQIKDFYFIVFFAGIIIIQSINLIFNVNKKPKLILTENLILELNDNEKVMKKINLHELEKIELTSNKINFYKKNHFLYNTIKGINSDDLLELEKHLSDICVEKEIKFDAKK